jgi:DNA-binding NarL/FixJ family response regulator
VNGAASSSEFHRSSAENDEVLLTHRQRQVVALIAEGCVNKEIAARLEISPRTARAHSDVLRQKLDARRRRWIPSAYRKLTGRDPLTAADEGAS